MYVSARERLLIDLLMEQEGDTTVKELADQMDVSVRTVHRDLKGIEPLLDSYGLSLVKKAGIGIQLEGETSRKAALAAAISHLSFSEYTPEERQTMLLCALLESTEPVKLVSLANELRVTIATVSSDLTKLESVLAQYGLRVTRRRGYGVELDGAERDKRRAMKDLIAEQINESTFLSFVKESIQKKGRSQTESISDRLLGLVEKRKLVVVEKVVKELNASLPYPMADSAYIGLVVHLALAVERIERGGTIQIDEAYFSQLKKAPEFNIAREMAEKLQSIFQIAIPEAEMGYITMHLQGAKLRQDKEYVLEESSFQIAMKAKSLIRFVENEIGKELSRSQSLFEGLVVHLKPALYRIQQKMGITNPLLPRIQQDYDELFQLVKKAVQHVFADLDVPDEEIAYLVMHFGSALYEAKSRMPQKAYIICSTGIGTSKMLAARLQQEVPELSDVKNISAFELNELPVDDEALVISTIQLPETDRDYIVVSPVLTESDLAAVQSYIKRKTAANRPAPKQKSPVFQAESELSRLHRYTEAMTVVLASFSMKHTVEQDKMKVLLEGIKQLDFIQDNDAVVEAVLKREDLGGIGIPGTSLAFYHARHDAVLKPSFTIIRLLQPMMLNGMDGQLMEAGTWAVMLSPESYHAEGLEVLSLLSAAMIESEEAVQLFERGTEQELKQEIAEKWHRFLIEKITH